MTGIKAQLVSQASAFLEEGEGAFETVFGLAEALIGHDEFGLARSVLDLLVKRGIAAREDRLRVSRRRALATYKDPHLNRDFALDRALAILDQAFELSDIAETETLGLAGAIHRRKWEVDGAAKHLSKAAAFYRAGHAAWRDALKRSKADETLSEAERANAENGFYPAINAAFLLDQLALLERQQAEEAGVESATANLQNESARSIREEILSHLSPLYQGRDEFEKSDYWPLVTLAEASLGLVDYAQAKAWLEKARQVPGISEWEYVSSARQLVHLVRIQTGKSLHGAELEQTEAWKALIDFLGENAAALRTIFQGKVGLALSGGGFRASLYHIGVLAKLAELDLLRHIEVISCVSGGSIIGAHYYLELRRLFDVRAQGRKDSDVTRDDYVQLVQRMADDFLAGVQENPRIQVLANPFPNFRMLWSSSYSRTTRLGELYERLIYSRIKDDKQGDVRWIDECTVATPEQQQDFSPRKHNWQRACKIPELILNATSLNSGHNWQFTATWMGESPMQVNPEIDTNARYRRMYYRDAPEAYRKVRLGAAVGASSCVPGLFEPIAIEGLFPKTMVRLVDGGVYDNQGISGLLEQECNVLLVSDASGQLQTEADPGGGVIKPLMRTNSTLMHRVRGSQYEDIKARKRASLVREFVYIHLKQGLDGETVDWSGSNTRSEAVTEDDQVTAYGMRKDVQRLVAGIRTDLDSFTDLEAYALMTSGYRTMGKSIESLEGIPLDRSLPAGWSKPAWKFLQVESGMTGKDKPLYEKMVRQLSVSPGLFMKVWKLHPLLKGASWAVAGALVLAFLVWWLKCPQCKPFEGALGWISAQLSLNGIMLIVAGFIASYLVTAMLGARGGDSVLALLDYKDTLRRLAVSLIASPVIALFSFVHLHLFDPLFKKLGKVE